MIKIMQTSFGEKGNCFNACVASILEIPIDELPDYSQWACWHYKYQQFLRNNYNYGMVTILNKGTNLLTDLIVIVSGPGPRGLVHSVLYRNGDLLHDPYPDNNGLDEIQEITLLFPLSPNLLNIQEEPE